MLADLLVTGRPDEAEEAGRRAFALREELAAAFPDDPSYRRNLSGSHHRLADLFEQLQRYDESEDSRRRDQVDRVIVRQHHQGGCGTPQRGGPRARVVQESKERKRVE